MPIWPGLPAVSAENLRFPDGGETYTYRKNGEIAGMLSVYPCIFQNYKCLSIGTVCTAPAYRGQGIMTALFTRLQEAVFPNYDIVTLCGKLREI